ncbi:hypothetical protein OIU78_011159 [Salix suchowensis]|nr:hypothetical protein OIU78_011159 [Salix suchowensis]
MNRLRPQGLLLEIRFFCSGDCMKPPL